MKLKKIITLAAAAAMLASGCSRGGEAASFSPKESSIYITAEGKITSATVEKCEGSDYTESELKSSVEEDLELVYGPAGEGAEQAAEIKECTIKDGTAKILIDFKDTDSYLSFAEAFSDEETNGPIKGLDIVTVADGLTKGYMVDVKFTKPGDGKTIESSEVVKQSSMYVAAVEGPALIQTEGKIQYVSENVTVTDGNLVRTPEEGKSYIVFK